MSQLTIFNANVVTPHAILENASVEIRNGKITAIQTDVSNLAVIANDSMIDAKGSYVIPGIIDLHTDAMDVEIIPRPGADFPIEVTFHELERKMAGCGITTVFHSLHMGYEAAEKESRSKYSREEVFETVWKCAQQSTHINNLIHLRYELPGVYDYDNVMSLINKGYVDLLSVMDHTPGQGQVKSERFIQFKMKKEGISKEEAEELMEKEQSRERIEGQRLKDIINTAKSKGIPVASHDDDTKEKVDQYFEMGVTISEFPINTEAAERAQKLNMSTIGGSSNILRGGSLSGNLDMTEAIKMELIDAICSDYYPPSILHSIFKLYKEGVLPLPEAVNLATINPARIVGMHDKIGSIEEGKNADILIVNTESGLPKVTHTIVNGHVSSQLHSQPQNEVAWQ